MSNLKDKKRYAVKNIVKNAMQYKKIKAQKKRAYYRLYYLEQTKSNCIKALNFHKNLYCNYLNEKQVNKAELEDRRINYYLAKKHCLEINYEINEIVTKFDIKKHKLTPFEQKELDDIYEPIRRNKERIDHAKLLLK